MRQRRRSAKMLIAVHISLLVLSAAMLSSCAGNASGDTAATEYVKPSTSQCDDLKGKDITLTVPFSPGGGYDSYARLIAPEMGDRIGATIVVENQEGAGGLLAMNNLLRAHKDGTEMLIMDGIGFGGASLAKADGVKFQLDDFSYIGRVAGDERMIFSKGGGPYKTWDDIETAQNFRFGATGPGGADFISLSLLDAMFDLDAKMITGFAGSSEVKLSLAQGDVDATEGSVDSNTAGLESGDDQAVLILTRERLEALPDVPTLLELDLDDEQNALAKAHLNLLDFGRLLVGPHGMDSKALACLRGSLAETVQDPKLVKQAEKAGRPFNYLNGEDLTTKAAELMDSPPKYLDVLKASFAASN